MYIINSITKEKFINEYFYDDSQDGECCDYCGHGLVDDGDHERPGLMCDNDECEVYG